MSFIITAQSVDTRFIEVHDGDVVVEADVA